MGTTGKGSPHFEKTVKRLVRCSERNGCELCKVKVKCVEKFDILANRTPTGRKG